MGWLPEAEAWRSKKPSGHKKVHGRHFMNFLTTVKDDGVPEKYDLESRYQHQSDSERAAIRAAKVRDGDTRIFIDTCKDNDTDEMARPHFLPQFFQECIDDGLGVVIGILPEDAPKMEAKYKPISTRFIPALKAALDVWAPYLTEVWIGVEASETLNSGEILAVAKAIRSKFGGRIVLHLGQGDVLPDGASGKSWWTKAKAAGINDLAYQHKHPRVEDSGGAFLADENTFKDEARGVLKFLEGTGIGLILSEYCYFGKEPTPELVQYLSLKSISLGTKATELGLEYSNGGPGYFEPIEIEPLLPLTGDELDISTAKFYTRRGDDISREIRGWPIDSVLTPSIKPDRISYDHSMSRSWPVSVDVNANSWIGFLQNGEWRFYTNDFLRPGQSTKEWPKLGNIDEPRTGWKASHGETVYLMVSRIARSGNYLNGKSRTQIVKAIVP